MPSFENPAQGAERVFREHQSREYLHPVVERAVMIARKQRDELCIKPESLIPPYHKDEVQSDNDYVRKREAGFVDDVDKKYADAFEGIVNSAINDYEWFGKGTKALIPSRYDDLKNGFDSIIEMEGVRGMYSHLGLGMDVTFGVQATHDKFERIKSEIKNGRLGTVKYFASGRSQMKGMYENMPRVVVGVERSHVIELAGRWIEPNLRQHLTYHPAQVMLLDEMISQLKYFRNFAEKEEQPHLVAIYQRTLAMVEAIRREKRDIKDYRKTDWDHDKVFDEISAQLRLFR